MLGVIITLLKIIGIFLLIAVLLVVCLIFALLFVPARYETILSFQNGKLNGKISAHWLLHLVHVKLLITDNQRTILFYIAGLDLKKIKKKKEEWQSIQRKKRQKDESKYPMVLSDEEKTDDFLRADRDNKENTDCFEGHEQEERLLEDAWYEEKHSAIGDSEPEIEEIESRENSTEQKLGKTKKRSLSLSEHLSRFWNRLHVLWNDILNLLKTIREKKEWVFSLLDELAEEPMKKSMKNLKKNLLKGIVHILPYKGNVNLEFGFENPAVTGQVLGGLAMVYPYFRGNLSLTPHFNQNILRGSFSMKGRIRAANLLMIALRIWRDRNLKDFIKKIKNGNHGGV